MATIAFGIMGYFRYEDGKETKGEYIQATLLVFIFDFITILATTYVA